MGASSLARFIVLPVTAVAAAITTYLVVSYAGADAYGYVSLISTLFLLLPFADLGVGAAIATATARRGESSYLAHQAENLVTRAFRVLILSGAVILVGASVIALLGLWPNLLGIPASLGAGANWVVVLVLIPFAVSLPLGIGQRILLGERKNHYANLASGFGPVLATLVTLLLIGLKVPPLMLAAATPVGVAAVSAISMWLAFRVSGWNWRLLIRPIGRRDRGEPLWRTAIPMFVISVAITAAMQSDRLVLAHVGSPDELAKYSLAAQFYAPGYSLLATAAITLWPVFARAKEGSLRIWRNTLLVMGLLGLTAGICFAIAIAPIARLVSGDQITVPALLAISFGSLLFVMALHQPSAMLLTAPRLLAFQAVCSVMMLVINLPLSIFLVEYLGSAGPVAASVVAVTVANLIPGMVRARSHLRGRVEEK